MRKTERERERDTRGTRKAWGRAKGGVGVGWGDERRKREREGADYAR